MCRPWRNNRGGWEERMWGQCREGIRKPHCGAMSLVAGARGARAACGTKNKRRTDRGAPGKGHGTYFIDMMRDWTGGRLQMVPTDTQLVCPARQSKLRRGFWIRCLRARTRVRTVAAPRGGQPARRPPQRPACSRDQELWAAWREPRAASSDQQQEQDQKSKATMIPGLRYLAP